MLEQYQSVVEYLRKIPLTRRNWYKQQVVKWIAAFSAQRDCLVMDSELILFAPRLWLNEDGVQLHYVLNDLNPQYVISCEKLFKCRLPRIDFVSHAALFQKDILKSLCNGNLEVFLLRWLKNGYTPLHASPICEWQTYASYLALNFPSRLRVGFQGQPLVMDTEELHTNDYFALRKRFNNESAIYLSHKERIHGA